MVHGYIIRSYYKTHTFGLFGFVGGARFHTIERPWLDNKPNVSCIPAGTYNVSFLPRSASGKYRKVWHVKAVSGRSGILIHNGNLVLHSRGCLILGMERGVLAGQPAVLQSKPALRNLLDLVGTQDFRLTII